MLIDDLKKIGFQDEFLIERQTTKNAEIIKGTSSMPGVYILMSDQIIPRLAGASNILYIGRSGNLQKRLKQLLRDYLPKELKSSWGKHTARESLGKIIETTNIKVSISYVSCSNYKELESKLLSTFCDHHIEGPPLNNQRR